MRQRLALPNDLKRFVRKSILKRVIPCVILFVLFATVLILWGNVIFNTKSNVSWRVFYYGLTLSIPFIITGVPLKLLDKTYEGTVKAIEISTDTVIDDKSTRMIFREHWYSQNTISLVIEKGQGKTVRKQVYMGRSKLGAQLDAYEVGDKVFHLYGASDIVKLPKPTDTHVKCAVCGSVNSVESEKCRVCGHTLIKNLDRTDT